MFPHQPCRAFRAGDEATIYHLPHEVLRRNILSLLSHRQLIRLRTYLGSRFLIHDIEAVLALEGSAAYGVATD